MFMSVSLVFRLILWQIRSEGDTTVTLKTVPVPQEQTPEKVRRFRIFSLCFSTCLVPRTNVLLLVLFHVH